MFVYPMLVFVGYWSCKLVVGKSNHLNDFFFVDVVGLSLNSSFSISHVLVDNSRDWREFCTLGRRIDLKQFPWFVIIHKSADSIGVSSSSSSIFSQNQFINSVVVD